MKNLASFLLLFGLIAGPAFAADNSSETPVQPVETAAAAPEAVVDAVAAAPDSAVPAEAAAVTEPQPTEPQPTEPEVSENLEFISGEVSATDETAKSITVKLYGETEQNANDKILTVTLDDSTDITDGEKDRDLKSLTPGTEVDVEYDSTTNKATYIFVY